MQEKQLNIFVIPKKVEGYAESSLAQDTIVEEADIVIYEPVEGETINVLLWERYPDYDMIFGVPDKTSKRYEKEMGFFTVRRVGHISYTGHYFDLLESEAMVEGFKKILELSKTHSPHLWETSMKI